MNTTTLRIGLIQLQCSLNNNLLASISQELSSQLDTRHSKPNTHNLERRVASTTGDLLLMENEELDENKIGYITGDCAVPMEELGKIQVLNIRYQYFV